jgi:excisionase family DNA binding protein
MRKVESKSINNTEALCLGNLTRRQAAKLCGVSLTTFDKWWREDGLPYYQLPGLGKQKRFNSKKIEEWQNNYCMIHKQKSVYPGIRKIG